jgi:hypothetical protein
MDGSTPTGGVEAEGVACRRCGEAEWSERAGYRVERLDSFDE